MKSRLPALVFLVSLGAGAQQLDDLGALEQLMQQEVFSVGKKSQRLDEAAAAVYVISQEDIRRSGVTSVVEALRLAPGVLVSRMSGNVWSVSIRGFSTISSDKLLVLMDGRTLYTPTYAGVYWDSVDTPLEDIERIEVMRGPAAAMWGTNAVNGVINIITKRPEATQGSLVSVTSGTEDWLVARYRYGGRIKAGTNYRVYGSQTYRVQAEFPTLNFDQRSWRSVQGGFRVDHTISDRTSLSLQGDLSRTDGVTPMQYTLGTLSIVPIEARGGNVLARWSHIDRWGGETTVQTYFDWNSRRASLLPNSVSTLDSEMQYRKRVLPRHELQLLAGARHVSDKTESSFGIWFDPANAKYNTYAVSAVDEFSIIPNKLVVTAGARADRLWLGGWSVQPTARALWAPTSKHSVWAAVSRATRVATRYDAAFNSRGMTDGIATLTVSDRNMRPESTVAYEVGFRRSIAKRINLDLTGFRATYEDLVEFAPTTPFFDTNAELLVVAKRTNFWKGGSYGGEASVTGEINDSWRVTGSLSAAMLRLRSPDGASGIDTTAPRFLWQVRSNTDLSRRLQADISFFGSTARISTPFAQTGIIASRPLPARIRMDARLGWTLGEEAELSFGVRDGLTSGAMEYDASLAVLSTGVRRNAYITLRWRL